MKFGYHDALLEAVMDYRKKNIEDVMEWYLEGTLAKNLGISVSLIERWEIDNPEIFLKDIEWFFKQINNNVFKRIQAPPVIVLSKTAFGYDLRESQLSYKKSAKYNDLALNIESMINYKEI